MAALALNQGELTAILTVLAVHFRQAVVWYGHEPAGAHHDYAPDVERETDANGKPTGKTVLCELIESAAWNDLLPYGLAKRIIDELRQPGNPKAAKLQESHITV